VGGWDDGDLGYNLLIELYKNRISMLSWRDIEIIEWD
jgi:hypothetical protein